MEYIRHQIIAIGHRLWQLGMMPAGDGNISARVKPKMMLITASGVSKGFLTNDDIIVLDGEQKRLGGKGEPSTEIALHSLVYKLRDDVNAVIHAHPVMATVFACTGMELPYDLLPEVAIKLGKIPTAPFALPSTGDVAKVAEEYIKKYNAFLLKNHGAVALGRNLEEAFMRMELVEHLAKVAFYAKLLGEYEPIPPEFMEKLEKMGEQFRNQ